MASIRPHWRKMTWAVLIFNVLMLIWLIAGIASAAHNVGHHCGTLTHQLCTDAGQAGATIGAGIIIGLWVAGDVILGVLWLVTRGRSCPACARRVRKGLVGCPHCGQDFRTGAVAAA